jgi:hypothetical protein
MQARKTKGNRGKMKLVDNKARRSAERNWTGKAHKRRGKAYEERNPHPVAAVVSIKLAL